MAECTGAQGERRLTELRYTLSRLTRGLSRAAQTPVQRATILVAAAGLAFLFGQWSAEDSRKPAARDLPATIAGTPLVLDGDTFDFNGVRVRIFGIDAFERDQICERSDGSRYGCGQFSREALLGIVANGQVTCARRDVDRYGRMVAVCATRDGDVGAHLVEEGAALAYREFSNDYIDEEARARQSHRGVWDGRFQAPWDYRNEVRPPR